MKIRDSFILTFIFCFLSFLAGNMVGNMQGRILEREMIYQENEALLQRYREMVSKLTKENDFLYRLPINKHLERLHEVLKKEEKWEKNNNNNPMTIVIGSEEWKKRLLVYNAMIDLIEKGK